MRDFLPAIILAVIGFVGLGTATVAPRTAEPVVVIFESHISPQDRVARAVQLGGTIIGVPAGSQTLYATFETLPTFRQASDQGVIAMLRALGAAGCAGQQV